MARQDGLVPENDHEERHHSKRALSPREYREEDRSPEYDTDRRYSRERRYSQERERYEYRRNYRRNSQEERYYKSSSGRRRIHSPSSPHRRTSRSRDDRSSSRDRARSDSKIPPVTQKSVQEALKNDDRMCVYHVRGLCKRGNSCKYVHKEPDLRALVQQTVWLKLCKKYPHECDGRKCSYLHVKKEDEHYYKSTGLITEHILGQAVRKALKFNICIEEDKSVCKDKLDGECHIINCPFLHLTREEFIKSILGMVKKEIPKLLGDSDCLFPSIEGQQSIVEVLLNPTATTNVPPPPIITMPVSEIQPAPKSSLPPVPISGISPVPISGIPPVPISGIPPVPISGILPVPMSQIIPSQSVSQLPVPIVPPPPVLVPETPEVKNIDEILESKLKQANDKYAKENDRYTKYIDALEKENWEIWEALDPEQDFHDLDDIRERILEVFEHINWKSDVKLFQDSHEYGHKSSKSSRANDEELHARNSPVVESQLAASPPGLTSSIHSANSATPSDNLTIPPPILPAMRPTMPPNMPPPMLPNIPPPILPNIPPPMPPNIPPPMPPNMPPPMLLNIPPMFSPMPPHMHPIISPSQTLMPPIIPNNRQPASSSRKTLSPLPSGSQSQVCPSPTSSNRARRDEVVSNKLDSADNYDCTSMEITD